MMDITNNDWVAMSDATILKAIGVFIKHHRLAQNRTQKEVADKAGINRTTLSLLEGGDVVRLSTLVQVLRILDLLYIMDVFEVNHEISPVEYAKLKKNKRVRASAKKEDAGNKSDLGW